MRVLELHSRLKVVQRSKGQSAVAAAAYRAAERLYDARTGEWKDYCRKQGVEHTALLLPDNAPDWAHDRSALWNAAEKKENRSNSQTARELEIGFPSEMTKDQRRLAGYQIAQTLVDRYGAGVDIAFHAPSERGDQRNHHAHIMFTVRRFDEAQPDGWAKKKDRVLDDRSKEPGAEHSKGVLEVLWLRENIANTLNDICVAQGHNVYVEHLSYEKRGLEIEPMQHLGPHASDMERNNQPTRIGDKNREIAAENAQRAQLEAQKNVIDLAAARIKAREEKRQLEAEQEAELRRTNLERREFFYQRVAQDRAALLYDQEQRLGADERRLREELVALHHSTEHNGFMGFRGLLHRITGRRAGELAQIEAVQRDYDRIQAQKALEAMEFERGRQQQLEALKALEAQQEAARVRVEQIPIYQPQQAANDHHAVRERAEAEVQHRGRERFRGFQERRQSQEATTQQELGEQRFKEFEERRQQQRRSPAPDQSQDDDLDISH